MTKLTCLFTFLFFSTFLIAQQYNDVAVIVNDNSSVSQDIADYFQQARNIPELNMIHVDAPDMEEIDPVEFQNIRQQIEDYLTDNNLKDVIHYMVTTKGVPLKVTGEDCINVDNVGFCASFESELALIFSSLSDDIGQPSGVNNPYFDEGVSITDATADIYLVSRLDGYTKQDVLNLIDRSGPSTAVNQLTSNNVFDISNLDQNGGEFSLFENLMEKAIDSLVSGNWSTTFHPQPDVLMNQENIFAYYSVNYPPNTETLNHNWVAGSVAEVLFGHSANTFEESANIDNNVLTANLVAEGATGAHGYVTYFYTSSALDMSKALSYYTDADASFNLAESFYMGMKRLSGVSVLVGDPKTTIVIDNTITSNNNPELDKEIKVFPNPGNGLFTIETGEVSILSFQIFNQLGQIVHEANEKTFSKVFTINLLNYANGVYSLQFKTNEGRLTKKLAITN